MLFLLAGREMLCYNDRSANYMEGSSLRTSVKIWIAVLLVAALLLTVGALFLFRHAFKTGRENKSGWTVKAGAICYLDKNGKPLLGWQEIEGKRYYFVPDAGIRATGWIQIGNDRYYFDEDGIVYTGWQEISGQKYYFDETGKMARGLYTIDGAGYFFQKNGAMGTGWQNADGIPCYFDETGKAITGWQEIDGVRYYFKDSGEVMVGWNTIGESLYYFTEEGKRLSDWQTIDGKRYYLTDEGIAITGWIEIDGAWRYFGEDGAVAAGWFEDETGKYFFDEKGKPAVGPKKIDEKWYYFNIDGRMATGWVEQDGEKYYCNENGEMAIGKVEIDGVNHFFTSKGKYVLLVNKENPVPDTYELNLVSYSGYQVDSKTKTALEEMRKSCPYATTIDNIYRSEALQQKVWDSGVRQRMAAGMTKEEAEAETAKKVMTPGHSEHQTGLAVDMFGSDEARLWLEEHCWQYGFIVRYPEEKAEFTGIDYEYWHFRYVGTELARELKDLGMCMEEYMQMLSK